MEDNGVAAGAAPFDPVAIPVLELPDDLRVPLHSLQADTEYLLARLVADRNMVAMARESIEGRLGLVAAAADRLNVEHRALFEVVKLALACEPDDWRIWRDQAGAVVSMVVSSMQREAGAEPSSASQPSSHRTETGEYGCRRWRAR